MGCTIQQALERSVTVVKLVDILPAQKLLRTVNAQPVSWANSLLSLVPQRAQTANRAATHTCEA